MSRIMMFAASLLSLGMGGFHLFLPRLFGWERAMQRAPDSLQWALLALNAFWSMATIAAGAAVLIMAVGNWRVQPAARATLACLALYWAALTAYLAVWPFPLPPQLSWLGAAFIGFASVQALLHACPALIRVTKS